jgi:hypothetical protein
VVHALIAHGDSPNYRYLGSHRLPSAGTAVRLQPQVVSTANASVAVLLKKFAVRSNSAAIERRVDPRVAALNQYTLGLPGRDRRNLAATGGDGLLTSGEPRVVASADGLRVRGQDDSQAQATHATYRRGLQDDFDVATAFDGLRLPASADDELELSVAIAGTTPQAARVSVARTSGGKLQITARLEPAGRPTPNAPPAVGQIEVESVDGLRIARIQRTMFFLYSENGFYRLLSMKNADPGPVPPGSVRFQLGGKGPGSGAVLLTTFEVRTSKFTD